MISRFLSFFSLYFGLCFASPLLVVLTNRQDIPFSLLWFSVASLLLVLALSSVSFLISAKTPYARAIATLFLSFAFVFAIQGNVVHDIFYYGDFNGQKVNWRLYGWKFWVECIGFLLAFPFFYWLLSRFAKMPVWLTLIPVVSSILLVTPALLNQSNNVVFGLSDENIDPEIFQFSSKVNLVHLIPDGFQGDIAREVLEDHPELAARLKGFTLYRNHLGMYQGTAPSIPTIYMGRSFDLEAGHDFKLVMGEMERFAYPARLLENGYRLDYLSIASQYCLKGASSCVVRPFNDMKPRGYFRHRDARYSRSLRLLSDLTIFRHLPMFLKEGIYNDGRWYFSDNWIDGSSPWPDPALREWIENMTVVGSTPRFKSYHSIGTHMPPYWDASCTFHPDLERNREQYYEQSICVLTGIAQFAEKLRELDIFDQTAIIVSGDHGIYIDPDDLQGVSANSGLTNSLMGVARPLLLVKPLKKTDAFQISAVPTSILDVAPTALDLVGLTDSFSGHDSLSGQAIRTVKPDSKRDRLFNRYANEEFWSGESISYDSWLVTGEVSNRSNWSLQDIYSNKMAPARYPKINFSSLSRTSQGFGLNRSKPDLDSAWIDGSEFSILVGTERPDSPATIRLTMRPPAFMSTETQTFFISINHHELEQEFSLHNREDWSQIEIPVPDSVLRKGNNFITLKFRQTATTEKYDKWRTAGELRSFHLVQ